MRSSRSHSPSSLRCWFSRSHCKEVLVEADDEDPISTVTRQSIVSDQVILLGFVLDLNLLIVRSHQLFSNLVLRQHVDIVDLIAQPHVQFWLKGQGKVKVVVEVEVRRLRHFISALHSVTQPLLRRDVEWIPSKFDLPMA